MRSIILLYTPPPRQLNVQQVGIAYIWHDGIQRPQSSSASRRTAGALGFLIFTQFRSTQQPMKCDAVGGQALEMNARLSHSLSAEPQGAGGRSTILSPACVLIVAGCLVK